jgi:uncharacterized protein (DUF362 family)
MNADTFQGIPAQISKQAVRRVVAFRQEGLGYPEVAPFDPSESYPEYPFGDCLQSGNAVYAAVREVLHLAGLDSANFGSVSWNPLSDLVEPAGTVLIKPNWVRHYHLRGEDIFSLITHPSILRALVDYAYLAVGPEGKIWVMDAPLYDTDYERLRTVCQLENLEDQLQQRGVPIQVADMREVVARQSQGVVLQRQIRTSWEAEGIEFDLGEDSEFADLGASVRNVFGSDYDRRITSAHHNIQPDGSQHHCYKIARRALEADLIISVPKLKTHKKTGVSLNIKNMIGINTDKNYIPHYRVGSPIQGGDEFPDSPSWFSNFRRLIVRQAIDMFLGRMGGIGEKLTYFFMRTWLKLTRGRQERKEGHRLEPIDIFYRTIQGDDLRTGNWSGNNTCWRPGLDIHKILFYGRLDGSFASQPLRRYFSLVDGVVAGEGDGPVSPTPRPAGVLIAGFDPVSVDRIATQVMGFDPAMIREIQRGEGLTKFILTQAGLPVQVFSNRPEWQGEIRRGSSFYFEPHFGWQKYLGKNRW